MSDSVQFVLSGFLSRDSYYFKSLWFLLYSLFLAIVQTFSVTKLNSTVVRAEWGSVTGASHYTVYYESTSSSSRKKRQVETGMRVFPGDTTEGLIEGLDPNLNYLFSISTSFNINGFIYEGERTQPIPPGNICTFIKQ